jgi:hypothetical protein
MTIKGTMTTTAPAQKPQAAVTAIPTAVQPTQQPVGPGQSAPAVTGGAVATSACCGAKEQQSCCAPAAKASCCGTAAAPSSCGCK